jgi:NADPH-dependent glutamate synthase beta subunit-like oxidoreductase
MSDRVMAILQEKFKGEMVHTSKFKSAKKNADKRVLVVGAGVSGHDIAWEHVNHGAGKHFLGRLTSNTGSENYLAVAEVVSRSNVTPVQVLRGTELVPERPYTNETPRTF